MTKPLADNVALVADGSRGIGAGVPQVYETDTSERNGSQERAVFLRALTGNSHPTPAPALAAPAPTRSPERPEHMHPSLPKVSRTLTTALLAFILGGYTFRLSGACEAGGATKWAWVAVGACVLGLAVNVASSLREGWRSD